MTKRNDGGFFGWIKRPLRWFAGVSARKRLTVLLVLLVVSVVALLVYWWAEIMAWAVSPVLPGTIESHGEALRNLALLVAALIGLPLAIWRSIVAQLQVNTAERGLLHDRYQRSAAMLGSDILATRIGGVYALEQLATEYTKEFHIPIMDLLCAFIRHPPKETLEDGSTRCSPDIEAAAIAIGNRSEGQIMLDRKRGGWMPDLEGAYLAGARLSRAKLSGAILRNADLTGAELSHANLSSASMPNAILVRTHLCQTILSGAYLRFAKFSLTEVSGANLSEVNDVTQSMLDNTAAKEGKEPKLDNAYCAETGEPLVWRGTKLYE